MSSLQKTPTARHRFPTGPRLMPLCDWVTFCLKFLRVSVRYRRLIYLALLTRNFGLFKKLISNMLSDAKILSLVTNLGLAKRRKLSASAMR